MPEMVSLFSGLGGLDAGLEAAGWGCLFATDLDPCAIDSLHANRGTLLQNGKKFLEHAVVEQIDIRELSGRDLLTKVGRCRGDIALLAGGPPCQSWSSAGHQLGFNDPRGRLIGEYLRLATELDCRNLLFENVRGLITARGADGMPGSALEWLRDRLFRLGWQTKVELLNAADFGVAQRRVRVVLVGYRSGDVPGSPKPTHSKDGAASTRPWRSMHECLSTIDACSLEEVIRPTGRLAQDLALIKPGSGVKSPGKREATRPGGHWGYKQGAFVADPDLPARTVTANSQQDWIKDEKHGLRRLIPRECAALQSFAADWNIPGKRTDMYRLIGNAVPPILGQALGEALVSNQSSATSIPESNLAPLPDRLLSAIAYTKREELRNGPSRRDAPVRRRLRQSA